MGNKVSKIAFNGTTLEVNDPDTIDVQPSSEIETILVHNTSNWECQPIPEAIHLQDDLHRNSGYRLNPVSVGAVNDEFDRVKEQILNTEDVVYLTYSYDSSTNKVYAKATAEDGYEIEIKDKLEVLVFSLKSKYDQSTETYTFDHFLGKITVNTTELVSHSFEGSITLENSQQNRVLYFVILNPVGISGQHRISKNNILFANNTQNTITLSSSDGADYSSVFNILFNTPLTDSMKIRVTVCDGRFGEVVNILEYTIPSGNSSYSVVLDPSGYKRTVSFEIIEDGNNPIYNVINNNLVVNPRINTRVILFYKNPDINVLLAQIVDGQGLEIKRDSVYGSDFINRSYINSEFPATLDVYADTCPSPGYISINAPGRSSEVIQEIIDEEYSYRDEEERNILFEGNNIYMLDNCSSIDFIINRISGELFHRNPANFDFKYFVDETLDSDYTQFEIWFVDKKGYLQTCYKRIY